MAHVSVAFELVERRQKTFGHFEQLAFDYAAISQDQRRVITQLNDCMPRGGLGLGKEAGALELGVVPPATLERAINEESDGGHAADVSLRLRMSGRNFRAYSGNATRALAAELGHEIHGGLSFFRLMAEQLGEGKPLDAEEASAFAEELQRLGQLATRLRELAKSPLERAEHTPRALVEAARARAAADSLPLELQLEGDESVRVSCDLELVAQGLAALIDNALEARQARAGVNVTVGAGVTFCVWDDGPGFPGASGAAEQALRWGYSTRPGALGLGLTLALRAARSHGFTLAFEREGSRTRVLLTVPARDVLESRDKVRA